MHRFFAGGVGLHWRKCRAKGRSTGATGVAASPGRRLACISLARSTQHARACGSGSAAGLLLPGDWVQCEVFRPGMTLLDDSNSSRSSAWLRHSGRSRGLDEDTIVAVKMTGMHLLMNLDQHSNTIQELIDINGGKHNCMRKTVGTQGRQGSRPADSPYPNPGVYNSITAMQQAPNQGRRQSDKS